MHRRGKCDQGRPPKGPPLVYQSKGKRSVNWSE